MTVEIADLFCGAGGFTTGAVRAAQALGLDVDLVAVNHWDVAIATHSANHPQARHVCISLDAARPEDLVSSGSLDLLIASPECTHHSRARGGKPVSDQQRMSAWHVQRWASVLCVRHILVENVPEFQEWGPLTADGKPDPTKKGVYFQAWVQALWAMGYDVEWRLLNAADYGDVTTRTRFFLQARRDGRPIAWPEPTHRRVPSIGLFGRAIRWRAAREVIDWSHPGASLFARRRPLSLKTRLRIAQGFVRFGGSLAPHYLRLLDLPAAELDAMLTRVQDGPSRPFVLANRNHNVARPLEEPLPGLTTAPGGGIMHVETAAAPFVLGQHGGAVARSVEEPLPTIATGGAISVTCPFTTPYYQHSTARTVEDPLPTITTKDRLGLCEPVVVPYGPTADARSVDAPLPTIMTRDRLGVCTPTAEPFIVPQWGERVGQVPRVHPIGDPLPAVTSHGAGALVEPVQLPTEGDVDPRRVVEVDGTRYLLDIRFRMLTPRELGAAMGFGSDYTFAGTAGDVTKQIGNAVAVHTATALVRTILESMGVSQ